MTTHRADLGQPSQRREASLHGQLGTHAGWIAEQDPSLVIHTGDVSVDGAGHEPDLALAAAHMAELGKPVLTVPGNHDVGLPNSPTQPVNAERLARWDRSFGRNWWLHDIPGWRLIGLNAMLFGSGDGRRSRAVGLALRIDAIRGWPAYRLVHAPAAVHRTSE